MESEFWVLAKTFFLACVSPLEEDYLDTLNTLRVAQRAVLGFAAGYAFAPHAKRTGAQLSAHDPNDLGFGYTQSLENGFERGAILPSHLNHGGDITRRQVTLER